MASRQNKEARANVEAATSPGAPTYGAPMGPPVVSTEEKLRRERERQTKLEIKPSDEERAERIAEDQEQGIEETAKKRRDRKTEAPKPPPYTRIGETTGKSPAQIIAERPGDVGTAADVAEGVEPLEEEVEVVAEEPTIPIKERNPPKRK